MTSEDDTGLSKRREVEQGREPKAAVQEDGVESDNDATSDAGSVSDQEGGSEEAVVEDKVEASTPACQLFSTAVLCAMCRFLRVYCDLDKMPVFSAVDLEKCLDSRSGKPMALIENIIVALLTLLRQANRKYPKVTRSTYAPVLRKFLTEFPEEFQLEHSSVWLAPTPKRVEILVNIVWHAMEDNPDVERCMRGRLFDVDILRPKPSFRYLGYEYYVFSQRDDPDACRMYRERIKTQVWEVVCSTWEEMKAFASSLSVKDAKCRQLREFCLEESEYVQKAEEAVRKEEKAEKKKLHGTRELRNLRSANGSGGDKGPDGAEEDDEEAEEQEESKKKEKEKKAEIQLDEEEINRLVQEEIERDEKEGNRRSTRLREIFVQQTREDIIRTKLEEVERTERRTSRSRGTSRFYGQEEELDRLIEDAILNTEGEEGKKRLLEQQKALEAVELGSGTKPKGGRNSRRRQLDEEVDWDVDAERDGGAEKKKKRQHIVEDDAQSDSDVQEAPRKRRRKTDDDDEDVVLDDDDDDDDDDDSVVVDEDEDYEDLFDNRPRSGRRRPARKDSSSRKRHDSASSNKRGGGSRPQSHQFVPGPYPPAGYMMSGHAGNNGSSQGSAAPVAGMSSVDYLNYYHALQMQQAQAAVYASYVAQMNKQQLLMQQQFLRQQQLQQNSGNAGPASQAMPVMGPNVDQQQQQHAASMMHPGFGGGAPQMAIMNPYILTLLQNNPQLLTTFVNNLGRGGPQVQAQHGAVGVGSHASPQQHATSHQQAPPHSAGPVQPPTPAGDLHLPNQQTPSS
eukprot:ANDGO_06578.mRNA.1 hypothetical protein